MSRTPPPDRSPSAQQTREAAPSNPHPQRKRIALDVGPETAYGAGPGPLPEVDLVLDVAPVPDAGTGTSPLRALFSRRHNWFIWWLAGFFSAACWPTRWSRSVAHSVPPSLWQFLLVALFSAGVALLSLWWLAPGASFSVLGSLWAGWSVLFAALWLGVLVKAQGFQGAKAGERFWVALVLSAGGLAAAAVWWLLLWGVMRQLGHLHPAVTRAWEMDVGHWVAACLAASAFAVSAWVALRRNWRLLLGCAGFVLPMGVATLMTPFMPWVASPDEEAEAEIRAAMAQAAPAPQALALTPAVIERQQAAFVQASQTLKPRDPARINLYAIVFAPHAGEEVFRNETRLLNEVLGTRFEAQGRVFTMLNHDQTAETTPWATRDNLLRAVHRMSQVMDKEHDILFIYLTSHGGQDHKLSVQLNPLTLAPVDAQDLRIALDMAGIRHRVVAVSACYSGGWVAPLQGPTTLVMTAADATHTSYGCGHGSELTYFGRAVFDEQLRHTRSFETAFRQAVPLIQQRELEGGKPDGFSNPQIAVGTPMRAYLKRFEGQAWPARILPAAPLQPSAMPASATAQASAPH